ncbi:MAG: DUF2490 domain-containing protein [Bacteroidales bacterium]|nr:DUF2490 domain-containing protein [Bacteroidales bacterium]
MRKRLLIGSLALSMAAFAQSERTTDFGGIASAELEVGLPAQFGLSVEEELRFDHNCVQFDRWLNSVGVDYTCWHNRMNIGLTADYIRRHNDRGYYENRGRLGLQVTYTEEYRRFRFQVRSKAVGTFFDERTGEHRVNPRLYWRNRLKVTYQPMNSRFKYALSTELFWLTNDPKGSYVDNLRTVASVEYRLSRRHYLTAFARMDNDLQVKEPVDRFYFGLTFKAKY